MHAWGLCRQDTSTASLLDLLLGLLREVASLDDHGLRRDLAGTKHLEIPSLDHVDHRRLVGLVRIILPSLVRDEAPELIQIHGRAILVHTVALAMEVTHPDLPEVPGMVLVEVDAEVVLATGVPTAAFVLAVLADAPMAAGHMPAVLAVLLQVRRHILAGPPPALELEP